MGSLVRKFYTRPVPLDAVPTTRSGKPAVRLTTANGRRVVARLSADGTSCRVPSGKWYGRYTDETGTLHEVPLSTNKAAAGIALAELVKAVEQARTGVVDRSAAALAAHGRRPLAAHLDDWLAELSGHRRDANYVGTLRTRVRAVLDGCRWVLPGDLAADRLEKFLADMLAARPTFPAIPAGVETFTKAEAAALCNLSPVAFQAITRRHRLSGVGNGKARRFPVGTVEAVRDLRGQGTSVQTVNHHLRAVKGFVKWMVENNRLREFPFARVKPGNVKTDVRRRRGELTPDEVARLLAACDGPAAFRGLAGPDRRMLYRVALATGYRAAELAAAVLPAEFTKNRQPAVQPLPADLAADLRTYLRRPDGRAPVWPGTWAEKAADMLRADLDVAGLPFAVDGPEGPEVRDFHCLRNTYISNVLRAGADLKQAMTLARHSDPRLTTARYARTRLHDLGAVVNKLPAPPTDPVPLRATGTAGPLPLAAGSGRELARIGEEADGAAGGRGDRRDPLIFRAKEDAGGVAGRIGEMPPGGIEPPPYGLGTAGENDASRNDFSSSASTRNTLAPPLALSSIGDLDLDRIIAAWPSLPESSRRAVMEIISSPPQAGD